MFTMMLNVDKGNIYTNKTLFYKEITSKKTNCWLGEEISVEGNLHIII